MKALSGRLIGMLAVLALALVAIAFQGCNTFRGLGKDIQRGGRAIEDAASK